MTDLEPSIPKITNQDIQWVQDLMGLHPFDKPRRKFLKSRSTVDLSACPGSGKTTLIVAKLAILARKWPHRTKGICVLSHTNVAREQIEHRLGRTVVGQRLLAYPHFIDTIHAFVNRFLALPWLYSNGFPPLTIDDDVTTAYRRVVLGRKYHGVQKFLERKHSDFDNVRICNRDLSFDLNGKPFPAGSSSNSFKYTKGAIEAAAKAGYFCYDEMFVWADALLEDCSKFPEWIAHRFPLFVLDEMQDTSERQTSFLNAVFSRTSDKIVVQRVGDPNQEIFDLTNSGCASDDVYPDPEHSLELPDSYRFGNDIAMLASPFAVQPVGTTGLSGIGPMSPDAVAKKCKHAIFVFPEDNTDGVLEAFGKHALDVLGVDLVTKGTVNAVGHVHRDEPDVLPGNSQYPKSVGHYWKEYSVEISHKDPNPRTLAQYLRVAQGLVTKGRTLSLGVEKIAAGTLELARRLGDLGDLKRRARSHRSVMTVLEGDAASRKTYQNLLRTILVERVTLSKKKWLSLAKEFTKVATTLCNGETKLHKAKKFLAWPKDEPSLGGLVALSGDVEPNVLRVSDGNDTINVRLGSIHSVKGQTHLATLLLSTFWYQHSAKQILPWLIGSKVNGHNVGERDKQRLLHTYVAMTRPSHLLCLAVPCSALGTCNIRDQSIFVNLRQRGWHIAEIVKGEAIWRD